jgi:hypothetical protein
MTKKQVRRTKWRAGGTTADFSIIQCPLGLGLEKLIVPSCDFRRARVPGPLEAWKHLELEAPTAALFIFAVPLFPVFLSSEKQQYFSSFCGSFFASPPFEVKSFIICRVPELRFLEEVGGSDQGHQATRPVQQRSARV